MKAKVLYYCSNNLFTIFLMDFVIARQQRQVPGAINVLSCMRPSYYSYKVRSLECYVRFQQYKPPDSALVMGLGTPLLLTCFIYWMLAVGTEASIGGSCSTDLGRIGIYIHEFRMEVARREVMTRISGNSEEEA